MIEASNYEEKALFEKKCLNVGLLMPSKITNNEKQTTLIKLIHILSKLHYICPEDLYNYIINNSPKSYPSSTRITQLNSQKHNLYGRRLDTSMLFYDVSNCDCCGKIRINHGDNLLERENINKRFRLTRKKYNVWKCYCIKTCSVNNFIVLKN